MSILPVTEGVEPAGNGGIAEEIDLLGLYCRLQFWVLRELVEIARDVGGGLERPWVERRKQGGILFIKGGDGLLVMAIAQRLGPFLQCRMDLRLQLLGLRGGW